MGNRPIGIFDSGVGGLTVVKSLLARLPGESFVYYGDTAHVPYGTKNREELCKYARNIISFLLSREVKTIVVACNTSSSVTLPEIEKTCPVPIVGVVKPGARSATRATINGKIGV
ncbi:MAG: aspartate/glutamate racemase family protein, partial [Syntrophomonas sp.]|nr:aspartate/glutamate racemase family protein [Syntrophomonas sp.]